MHLLQCSHADRQMKMKALLRPCKDLAEKFGLQAVKLLSALRAYVAIIQSQGRALQSSLFVVLGDGES